MEPPIATDPTLDPISVPTVTAGLPQPGDMLGVYRLLASLGEGGMGVVYLAEHTRLERKVALKLLRPELAADAVIARRFLAEARAVNRVQHRNVIEITDIVEDARKYYIMELLKGETLANLQARLGVLPLARSLRICLDLAAALAAVHDGEVIHCDVKPDNVFLNGPEDAADHVKLIDFGIARLPGSSDAGMATALGRQALGQRNAGDLVGTPAYMSPEQVEHQGLTYQSDIYSFGALLYHLLSGKLPFDGASVEDVVLKHVSVDPKPPSSRGGPLPAALDDLVLHCLAKRPADRPSSMQEIEFRLSRILEEVRTPPPAPARPAGRRRRLAVGAVLGMGALGVALAAWFLLPRPPPPTPPPVALPTVRIAFASSPPGATVLDAAGVALGVTPVALQLPRAASPGRFTFRLEGWTTAAGLVSLAEDGGLEVQMERPAPALEATPAPAPAKPKRRPSRTPRPRQRVDHDAVKDPFAD